MKRLEKLDAYWTCCGLEFRDKVELVDHELADLEKHRIQITRTLRQHARMWAMLKKRGIALEIRRGLDTGEMDWWNEIKAKANQSAASASGEGYDAKPESSAESQAAKAKRRKV